MLRIFISFFAGVLVTLYFLIPGKIEPRDLLDSQKRSQLAHFDQAGEKIEQAGDMAVFYACKAGKYVHNNMTEAQ